MSPSERKTAANQSELEWPRQPSGIFIMGKRQGTKKENKQLRGRIAMAAALWYSAPQPKPYLIFVAADIHGPPKTPDAEVVKNILIKKFDIPADFLIIRQKTNCTLLEVRAVRAIARAYNLAKIFAVTHLYHAPRAQRYIWEVLGEALVIPAHPAILTELTFPIEAGDLFDEVQAIIQDSQPGLFDTVREQLIEWLLTWAHRIDSRGRFERQLARLLRPDTYENSP